MNCQRNYRIAVIENDPMCPLDRLETLLSAHEVQVFKPYRDEGLPNYKDLDVLIALGGSQATKDLDNFPWLESEKRLLRLAHEENKHVLGICLGAQLLAEALGGVVTHGALTPPELGVTEIKRTERGHTDEVFGDLAMGSDRLLFTSSHSDVITALPNGAVLLGSSRKSKIQAFRLQNSIGVQFHPEVSFEQFQMWMNKKEIDQKIHKNIMHDMKELYKELEKTSIRLLRSIEGRWDQHALPQG